MSAFKKAFAAFKEAMTDLRKSMPLSEAERAFLIRLRDDPDKRIHRILQNFDNADQRTALVHGLRVCWQASQAGELIAPSRRLTREQKKMHTEFSKWVGELVVSKKIPLQRKAEILKLAIEYFALADRLRISDITDDVLNKAARDNRERFRQLIQMLDKRSDRSGSRARTNFMRMASCCFYQTTGQWHDDWVADLTDVAFPKHETTIVMVRHARRGIRAPEPVPEP